jgi:hypothetical protein
MTSPVAHPIARNGLRWLGAIVIMLGMAVSAVAGVALPPMPDQNDTNAMEQYRIKVFYDAQKSEQEKLRVGRVRYQRDLAKRAAIVQERSDEFAERANVIVMPAQSSPGSGAGVEEQNSWVGTAIGVAAIGLAFLGFRYYLSRQDAKGEQ